MKKFYLLGGMAVATALIAAATTFPTTFPGQTGEAIYADVEAEQGLPTPYSSTPAVGGALAPGWSIINHTDAANNKYWTVSGTDMTLGYHSTCPKDDYLISPQISFEAGVEYIIAYTWKGGSASYPEKVSVYLSPSNTDTDIIKSSTCLYNANTDGELKSGTATKITKTVTPAESAGLYIVFYAHSDKDKLSVSICNLLVAKNEFAPAGVTNLTATAAANRELKCTLSWKLPTTDCFGAALPEDKPITAVNIYRDGGAEAIAVLEGNATTFEDTEATELTPGKHTYEVSVVADGVESSKTAVGPTAYVGPVAATPVPCKFSFASEADFTLWSQAKGDVEVVSGTYKNTEVWKYDYTSGGGYAKYTVQLNYLDNDWLFAMPVKFEEPGYYRVALGVGKNSASVEGRMRLDMGKDPSIDAMSPVSEYFDPAQVYTSATEAEFPVVYKDIKIEEPGDYYFGIHTGDGTPYTAYINYYVKYFAVEKTVLTPNHVSNLTATPADDGSTVINVSWTNPATATSGDAITADEFKVEVYVNDEENPAATITDGSESCAIEVPTPDVYTITVKTIGTATGATMPGAPSVKTTWVGPKTVEIPYVTKFASDDNTINIWEAVDVNKDGITYKWSSGSGFNMEGSYSSPYKSFNDYAVSPIFSLEEGFYKIVVSHSGGQSSEKISPKFGLVKNGTFDAANEECFVIAHVFEDFYSYSSVDYTLIVKIEEAGDYQAVYGLEFESTYYSGNKTALRGLSIESQPAYPANVTDLNATVGENKENKVTLTWVNPSTVYGTEIALDAVESVVIERDGNVVAILTEGMNPGESATYTDEEVPSGLHTYTVYATLNGEAHGNEYASVKTDWVGAGMSAPIEFSGSFPGWYSDDNWKFNENTYIPSNSYWGIDGTMTTAHDDYLVTCPINIEEQAIYQVTFNCSGSDFGQEKDCHIAVKMGTGDDHTQFDDVYTIVIPKDRKYYTYVDHSYLVAVGDKVIDNPEEQIMMLADAEPAPEELYAQAAKVEPGEHRIALHITEPGGTRIRNFKFEKIADYEGATTEIVEVGATEVTFDGQDVNFGGVAAVQVYNLAGVCVANTTAEGSFNVSKLGAGYYIVKVTTDSETVILKVTVK